MKKPYPKQRSLVTITFNDGEVREYYISAGSGIAGYLMSESRESGIITLRDDERGTATCVPVQGVRDINFAPEPKKENNDATR